MTGITKKTEDEEEEMEEKEEKDPYDPPDGGWGWLVVMGGFFCCLVLDGITYCFGIFLTPLMEHYNVGKGPMSAVGSILGGTIQLVGPFVAILVNTLGARKVCIAGAVISALGFFLSTFAPSVPLLIVTYSLLGGLGFGLMYVPAVCAPPPYFKKYRALATGITVCGSGAGTFLLAPLASYLLNIYGWEGATRVFAALCFQCALCGAIMRPLPKRPSKEGIEMDYVEIEDRDDKEKGSSSAPAAKEQNCLQKVFVESCSPQLFTSAPFLLVILANLFSTMGLYIPYMFLPKLAEENGISPLDAAFLISVIGITNTIGRIITGLITDLPKVCPLMLTTIALGLGGVCPLLMALCTSYWSFMVVSVMFGGFLSAWVAATPPVLIDLLGLDLLTSAFGNLTFIRGFACLMGPLLAGFIVDATGVLEVAFYISFGLLMTSSVICGLAWCVKKFLQKRTTVH